jgi:LytS/YehU family sensor histidine kinase
MSALGTFLSVISINIALILQAASGQGGAALDLSHIATFVAAIFIGPYSGAVVGLLSGIYAGYYFGYVMGSLGLLSLVGVPLGKAITGFTAGWLYRKLGVTSNSRPSTSTVLVSLLSYIPECLYTISYFLYVVMYVYGNAMEFMLPIVIPKAWIEILFISLLMGALVGNTGFKEFVLKFFHPPKFDSPIRTTDK